MKQAATHELLFKQLVRDQTDRRKDKGCEQSYGNKDALLPDSNSEDEISSNRFTEESYDVGERQPGTKGRGWNGLEATINHQRTYSKLNQPESLVLNSYFPEERETRKEKLTQKNYSSPLSSSTRPPLLREFSGPSKQKFSTTKPREPDGVLKSSDRFSRPPQRTADAFGNKTETICYHHRQRDNFGPQICDRHKVEKSPKVVLPNVLETVMPYWREGDLPDVAEKSSGMTLQTEALTKNSTEVTTTETSGSRHKSTRDNGTAEIENKCPDCFRTSLKGCDWGRVQNMTVRPSDSERQLFVHDSFLPKPSLDDDTLQKPYDGGNKVKEKLVYVVEEEGKNATKMETDLFSFNEILAIKKDLLELSKFAKKLKKLKEMKKVSEKGSNDNKPCRCKPVAELLRDVNKRIEALEARQEELERGSTLKGKIEDSEKGWKTVESPKTSETSPKTPVLKKQSAMTSVPSLPKTDVIVSRAEGFSNNSEIVNELMDLKTQLQRLEKRRMSKKLSAEAVPPGASKSTGKKDHAIAVFSSRTYILTSNNYANDKPKSVGEKTRDSLEIMESKLGKGSKGNDKRLKPDLGEDTVVNWLKNVPMGSDDSSNHFGVCTATGDPANEKSQSHENSGSYLKTRKYDHTLKIGDFENQAQESRNKQNSLRENNIQETQKNRATETDLKKPEPGLTLENEKPARTPSRDFHGSIECRECLMTPSGRLFKAESKAKLKVMKNFIVEAETSSKPPLRASPIRQSVSSSSIPSVLLAKEQIKKLSRPQTKGRISRIMNRLRSKSMQDLPTTSLTENDRQSPQRSFFWKDKRNKESKNEMVKKKDEVLGGMKKKCGKVEGSPSSNSEFLGTVNLEPEQSSENFFKNLSPHFKGAIFNNLQLYSVTTMSGNEFQYCSPADKFALVVQHPEMKDREMDKKKRKKHKSECKKHVIKIVPSPCKHKKEKSHEAKKDKKLEQSSSHRKKKKSATREEEPLHTIFRCPRHDVPVHMVYTAGDNQRDYHFRSKDLTRISKCGHKKHCRYYYTCEDDCRNKIPVECPVDCDDQAENDPCEAKKSEEGQKTPSRPEEDSCMVTSFFKGLRGFYPRIGGLRVVPWLGYCDKQCKTKEEEKLREEKKEEEDCEDPCLDYQTTHKQRPPPIRAEHLRNCKCVQVYLESQARDWPGSRPFRNLRRRSPSPSDYDIVYRGKNSPAYYIGHSSEVKKKSKKKRKNRKDSEENAEEDGSEKPKKRKKKLKIKKEKSKKKEDNRCVCDKCGNVHKRKKAKKPRKKKRSESSSVTETESKTTSKEEREGEDTKTDEKEEEEKGKEEEEETGKEEPQETKPKKKRDRQGKEKKRKEEQKEVCKDDTAAEEEQSERRSPVFSFLRGFCPKSRQSKPCLCNKFNEIRYLKTCKTKKKGKKTKEEKKEKSENRNQYSGDQGDNFRSCDCPRKEKTEEKSESEESVQEESEKTPETDQTNTESTITKKCECRPKLDDLEDRLAALEEMRRKKSSSDDYEEKKKRKKKKNKKKECICSSEECEDPKCKNPREETVAYFCTCLSYDNVFDANHTNPEASSISSKPEAGDGFRYGGKRLKQKLSSLQSLWKTFKIKKNRKRKDEGDRNISDDEVLNDCSRSSPVPTTRAVHTLINGPVDVLRTKHRSKRKKERISREKSKSRGKRHR